VRRRHDLVAGVALLAVAAAVVAVRGPLGELAVRGGAPAGQRHLAGGTAGHNDPVGHPVRVILIDGLSRHDVADLAAVAARCASGLDLIVDVGFPTKSLPVQLTLWSGLTTQQRGGRADNLAVTPPPSSVPLLVRGSHAVVEAHAHIAGSAGFARVEPDPAADGVAREAEPGRVAAWRTGGFRAAAAAAVATDARLVLVHLLVVDEAAHRHGRGSAEYAAALVDADATAGSVLAAAPDAQWLIVSDHGHVRGGGHGDAEDDVRRVRACWSPAPPGVASGAEVHLIDVARWIADAVGAPRHPHAVGRTLAVAAARPDPAATLPRPGITRLVAAAALVLGGLAGGLAAARRRWAAAWPLASAVVVGVLHGLPTLSDRAPALLLVLSGVIPAAAAVVAEVRSGAAPAWRRVAALLGLAGASAAALGIVGAVSAIPYWTGLSAAGALVVAGGLVSVGAGLVFVWFQQLATRER
jgi:hypothetical protein